MKITSADDYLACIVNDYKILLHSDILPFVTLITTDKSKNRIPLQAVEVVSNSELIFSNGLINVTLTEKDGIIKILTSDKYYTSISINLDNALSVFQNEIALDKRHITNVNNKHLKEKKENKAVAFIRDFLYLDYKKEKFSIENNFKIGAYTLEFNQPIHSVDLTFKNAFNIVFEPTEFIAMKLSK